MQSIIRVVERVCLLLVVLAAPASALDEPAPPVGAAAAIRLPAMAADWWQDGGESYRLDTARSFIRARVYRAGHLANLGHNHVVEVNDLRGRLLRRADHVAMADLTIRADHLRVDDAAARREAGDDFASDPNAEAVAATRRNMLSERVLDADAWPEIELLARADRIDGPTPEVELWLRVRGVLRSYRLPVTVHGDGDTLSVRGKLSVRHSDFALVPFAALAGALQVRDAIDVDFHIVGQKTGRAL